jgi:hypothetical protein
MRIAVLSAALLAAAPGAHAVDLGPLAQAADGKVQCYAPNPVAKSCQSIGAYRITPAGAIENEAIVMVSSSPLVVMTTRSLVQIKGGADCGVMRQQDIATASFTVEGRPATPDRIAALRATMLGAMRPMLNHEICVFYRPQAEGLLATTAVDGRPRPDMDQKVLWVSPAEGWKVGF